MSEGVANRLVGTVPWLPWPLSAWNWWTRPVRAERLAGLRIGLALLLLADVVFTYGGHLHDFFGPDSLGSPELFAWRGNSPRLAWSLLRGVGDPLVMLLTLALLVVSTLWILGRSFALLRAPRGTDTRELRPTTSLLVWALCGILYSAGVWAQLAAAEEASMLAWAVPTILAVCATLFLALDALRRYRHGCTPDCSRHARRLFALIGVTLLLLAGGIAIGDTVGLASDSLEARLLGPWQQDLTLLRVAFGLWITAIVMLLMGLATPFAAFATWAITLSFANVNSYIDNAGDTIRNIILFYLILCPCGAVWSVDHRFARRGQPREVVWVPPWPMRLLFVQLILIYFCNGVYKLTGSTWLEGDSLFYVMGDLTLTRFSLMEVPLTPEPMRWLTWSVLAWEVSFPLLVLWRPTRLLALVFGVAFHLGIFVSMELGMFVPYALCLYLPLVPWEWLADRRGRAPVAPTLSAVASGVPA